MGNESSSSRNSSAAQSSAPSSAQAPAGTGVGGGYPGAASGTAARQPNVVPPGAYSVPGNPSRRQNQQFYVTVPRGVRPGHEFPVLAGGHQLMVRLRVLRFALAEIAARPSIIPFALVRNPQRRRAHRESSQGHGAYLNLHLHPAPL